jgi:hypothetical protein
MTYLLHILLFLIARYLHIVCATVLVGGTLFYEMVVPPAIDDLKPEQQLLIFARARLFFKWLVWLACLLLLFSGVICTYGHWGEYNRMEGVSASPFARPGWWWAAHASCGTLSVFIAISLTIGKAPPSQPIRWMRLNLMILLLVMFLATVTRQTRLESSGGTFYGPTESTEIISP